ncbi:MAG: Fic family protein [Caulobacteraceae bacterium]|nr:Fic family protein [Caulobacteraceae bacterium]
MLALRDRIEAVSSCGGAFVSTFGLELKAATVLARDGDSDRRLILGRFISRPAAEPILLHVWREIMTTTASPEDLKKIGSGLAGRSVELARGRMRTYPSTATGQFTVYADASQRERLMEYLAENSATNSDPVAKALVAYALVILCHPLTDGNGRLARAFVTGSLAREGLLTTPCLPLGPAFYLHARIVADSMAHISETGAWADAVDQLAVILETACDLAAAVAILT